MDVGRMSRPARIWLIVAPACALALALAALVVALTDGSEAPRRAVVIADSGQDPTPDKWVNVYCPKGYTVVGGGGQIPHGQDTPGVALYWSAPYENGWQVAAQDERRGKFPWTLQVLAVCLEGVTDRTESGGSLPPSEQK